MIKVERDKVAFYQFLGLRDFPGLSHFVSGREGGVSVGRQTALNLGFMDEDRDERVLVNRMLLAEAIGCGVDDFTLGEQKHTTHVEVVDRVQRGRGGRGKATRLPSTDALITKETGVCLMVLAADCVPVLMYDSRMRVIAAVHAGWRGTVGKIAAKTVERMREEFGCDPRDIIIGIGPSIGPCCFEVGEEVIEAAGEGLGDLKGLVEPGKQTGKYQLNLWEANRRQLRQVGVEDTCIEVAGICTVCHRDQFFSYRGDRGNTGRFGAGIMLNI
ncbi:MAG TPA: peptidoglycan editing factor PgeF [Candidatus Butyricimonas faecavium]|mgnify:CR=1 FL=1|nr:peptidoglycan editing factor PgeF [Candidatus Butyricimonas faecavium]